MYQVINKFKALATYQVTATECPEGLKGFWATEQPIYEVVKQFDKRNQFKPRAGLLEHHNARYKVVSKRTPWREIEGSFSLVELKTRIKH